MLPRGTPLHAEKEALELVESSDVRLNIDRIQENIPHVVASPTFTIEDWHTMAKMAESLDEYNRQNQLSKNHSSKMVNTLQQTLWKTTKDQTLSMVRANSLKT